MERVSGGVYVWCGRRAGFSPGEKTREASRWSGGPSSFRVVVWMDSTTACSAFAARRCLRLTVTCCGRARLAKVSLVSTSLRLLDWAVTNRTSPSLLLHASTEPQSLVTQPLRPLQPRPPFGEVSATCHHRAVLDAPVLRCEPFELLSSPSPLPPYRVTPSSCVLRFFVAVSWPSFSPAFEEFACAPRSDCRAS